MSDYSLTRLLATARSATVAAAVLVSAMGCSAIGNFPNSADTVTVYTTPPPQTTTPGAVDVNAPNGVERPVGVPAR